MLPEATGPAGCILFFMPVEIWHSLGKLVYRCVRPRLLLHFKRNQNGEPESEGYKIYYCRQREAIPEKREPNTIGAGREGGAVAGFSEKGRRREDYAFIGELP